MEYRSPNSDRSTVCPSRPWIAWANSVHSVFLLNSFYQQNIIRAVQGFDLGSVGYWLTSRT